MVDVAQQGRTGGRQKSRQADDKTIDIPSVFNSTDDVGRRLKAVPSFVSSVRARFIKALIAMLAIAILSLLFSIPAPSCSVDRLAGTSYVAHFLPHQARAVASHLLEVFQVYPPVLTVTPSGVLEITDGSSNATVKVVDSDRPTCQDVLAVHSFAFSYGKPFVGEYAPPSCSFNRVTWNLTVVSAGRQFDRLGIVYLGDIEVFRTSTAEPTTDGIEWTCLKVSNVAISSHELSSVS